MKRTIYFLAILFLFSQCTKNSLQNSPDLETINSDISSDAVVSVLDIPFPASNIYAMPSDINTWSFADIQRNTYGLSSDLEGYFFNSNSNVQKVLFILYNKTTGGMLKMVCKDSNIGEGVIKRSYTSPEGILHLSIELSGDTGRNLIVGQSPDMSLLGNYTANIPIDDPETVVKCSLNRGFGACLVCSHKDCNEHWACLIACSLGGPACLAGWIVSCAIINDPGNKPSYQSPFIKKRKVKIIKPDSLILKLDP